jgi:hypothetical protein
MLRITLPAASRSGSFILEGRLTGLWAKELLRVARAENPGQTKIFDLREVFYVDSQGEDVLRWLSGRGAKFIAESAYGKDLCTRLNLHRVGPSETGGNSRERIDTSRRPSRRRSANAEELNVLVAADVNQHSSSCRG